MHPMAAPISSAAVRRLQLKRSTIKATGTSSMDMEEVSAATLIKKKKAVASTTPAVPSVANNSGKTVKISVSSDSRAPLAEKMSTPRSAATYMAGRIRKPANTAIPTSIKATWAPMEGRCSRSAM